MGYFTAAVGEAADFHNPSVAKAAIERAMRQPQAQPESTAIYYGEAVSHIDSFIPFLPFMTETNEPGKFFEKVTYHNGLLVKCEGFDPTGKRLYYQPVWYNGDGAPVLSGYFGADGHAQWYDYAEYDASGKIHVLYRISATFALLKYDQFIYEENRTRIRSLSRDGKLVLETVYENGEVFFSENGEMKKIGNGTREESIRGPVKFGLKPIYPGY